MLGPVIKMNISAAKAVALMFLFSLFIMAFVAPTKKRSTEKDQIASHGSGTISGKVVYKGGQVRKEKSVIKDEHTCGAEPIMDESLLTAEDGGVQWAVVSISSEIGGKELDVLKTEAILDQSSCVFKPHIVLVGVNRPLVVINSDKTLHNVRTVSFLNDQVSKAQIAFPGSPIPMDTLTFSEVEVIETVCDVHGWMKAFIHVVDHPYHVITNDLGKFEIGDVPPGKYTLKVWHETLGEMEQEVTVSANSVTKIEFAYKKKK